jgi:hypothetical protein
MVSRRIAELLPCIDTGTTTGAQRAMLTAERARIQQRVDELNTAWARSTSSSPPPRPGAPDNARRFTAKGGRRTLEGRGFSQRKRTPPVAG